MSNTLWNLIRENRLASVVFVTGLLLVGSVLTLLLTGDLRTGFSGKTLWDWMEVVGVPVTVVLFAGGFGIVAQRASQRAQQESERDIERGRETTLREYLDRISDLILNHDLQKSEENSPVRAVARALTLASLRSLNGPRKGILVGFLYESVLISIETPVISLRWADLSEADLSGANLEAADLSEANLSDVDLQGANLLNASLRSSAVSNEELVRAGNLIGAIMPDGSKMTEGQWEEFRLG